MDVERARMLVTLKAGKEYYKKGAIIEAPIPSAIMAEISGNTGAVEVLGNTSPSQDSSDLGTLASERTAFEEEKTAFEEKKKVFEEEKTAFEEKTFQDAEERVRKEKKAEGKVEKEESFFDLDKDKAKD